MPHWVAVLTSTDEDDRKRPQPCETLQAAARCFNGPTARVRHIADITILESTRFDACTNGNAAFKAADEVLLVIHQILNLYAYLHEPFEIRRLLCLDQHDQIVGSRVRGSIALNVYSAKGLAPLTKARGAGTAGEFVIAQAFVSADIAAALRLAQTRDLTWQHIYDILEFMSSSPDGASFRASQETRRVRRTANHYRHSGDPRNSSLPKDPPSPADAKEYARISLKAWVTKAIGLRLT